MTLATRNAILLAGTIVAFAVLAFTAYVVATVLVSNYRPGATEFVTSRAWLAWSWKIGPGAYVTTLVELFLYAVAASAGGVLLRRFFLKTTAPEIFFFIVFVLSLSIDSLRSVQLLLMEHNVPSYYGMVVTRAVGFGQFLGLFCLLASSLYAVGVQYQKYLTVLGIGALVAFALAYVVPVDSLVLYPDLVYRVGNQSTIQIIQLILTILIVASYATAVATDGTRDRLVPVGAISCAVVGRQILFISANPIGVAFGFVLLVGGASIYSYKNYDKYLWTW